MDKRDESFCRHGSGDNRAVSFGNTALDNSLRSIFFKPVNARHAHIFQDDNGIGVLLGNFNHRGLRGCHRGGRRADLHIFIILNHISLSLL